MKTITVKGVGKVSVKPDLIVISMKLDTEDKEYEKIMETSAEKIEELNRSLETVGFEKNSIKTTNFNVRTRYENIRTKEGVYKNVFKGYMCSHSLRLEFDFDTKRLAKILSALSNCVAKPEISIDFTVKDPSAIGDELLKSAVENATKKAEVLCKASNAKLGELQTIDYNWSDINIYSPTRLETRCVMMQDEGSLANMDITPENIRINDTATFVWEIK